MDLSTYTSRWWSLVHRWLEAGPDTPSGDALLRQALRDGLESMSTDGGEAPSDVESPASADLLRCEISVVRLSEALDERAYVEHKRVGRRIDPVSHFCEAGWRDFANPSADFDVWWYWFHRLGLEEDDTNPFVHHLLHGVHQGWAGAPGPHRPVPAAALTSADDDADARPRVRRAFLFAGYDVDGLVDPYVVRFVAALARHGEVFYLADSQMTDSELDRLAEHTVGRWAVPHGRYDFGSYAMLACDLVGWERLEEYDEVVLVNDSCYSLRDFDHVFDDMDRRACDWWGFQATMKNFDREHGDTEPVPLDAVKPSMLGWQWHQMEHLHISSYFVALRRPAIADPDLRRLLEGVTPQRRKVDIILKYELGLSRVLNDAGLDFTTFVPDLYPFHPAYTDDTFELIRRGFPLLKRSFLNENTTQTADLSRWRERVLAFVPSAPVEEIEANLHRVSPDDLLRESMAVARNEHGRVVRPKPLGPLLTRRLDRSTPTFDHWWAFPVDALTHQLSSDARALYDAVADDPSIRKVVLTRGLGLELPGENADFLPLRSLAGQELLVRCRYVFSDNHLSVDVPFAVGSDKHQHVRLGQPGDLRTMALSGRPAVEPPPEPGSILPPTIPAPHDADELAPVVVTASRLAATAVMASYAGPSSGPVVTWPTGSPRHDLVTASPTQLPDDLQQQRRLFEELVAGRRVVLWMPGAPDPEGVVTGSVSDADLEAVRDWAVAHDVVVAVRDDKHDRSRLLSRRLSGDHVLHLSHRRFASTEALYGAVDVVVTDHAGHALDFVLAGGPVLLLGTQDDDEWFCDPAVLPVTRCTDLVDLSRALEEALEQPRQPPVQVRPVADVERTSLLISHQDGANSRRLAQRVRSSFGDSP